ncbi:acyl-CoA dehydrogenase family protein [Pseudonocardia abyssalis]|uniref:Acyl-CoA/acyl-ACP dehydrogenase n=1 Tax=Pseudonocardia abyssalis TaxID=2792008 RepID=A0ABS6V1X9_9PSEU|nr:acyl-CoA dehydrogenase family protein [Pseudonocardia abyssalis]MBW0118464.1 acyl-CoA/acyl-ACP dehydrogenase [Pseudonocardia abyssalis]MBW0138517.1 acyl-CoA/acyl-ACP dehydrogenase [Pseudonocardia abyssalis]
MGSATVLEHFALPGVDGHPAVVAAARIAADLLVPHAATADDAAHGVDPAHLDVLAEAGLLSTRVPVAEGGHGADESVDAAVVEQVAGACGATWFLTTQHRVPQALSRGPLPGLDGYRAGPAADRYRARLSAATTRAGIAIAHVRRPGPPAVRAEPAGTGWTFHGAADWCTGWGLLDVVMIAATTADDRFVLALLPARERPGLRAGAPLPLAVMGGTRTVALELDGLTVDADDVLAVIDAVAWRAHDAARTANATPASFGLLRAMLVALADLGASRPEALDAALDLAPRAAALRREAYGSTAPVAERTAVRAAVTELVVRGAHTLVAARSGSALLRTSPEQRWAREAAFHLIQAQTAGVRVAQLRAFTGRA